MLGFLIIAIQKSLQKGPNCYILTHDTYASVFFSNLKINPFYTAKVKLKDYATVGGAMASRMVEKAKLQN